TSITTSKTYDVVGNVRTETDGRLSQTQYNYTDAWGTGSSGPPTGRTYAFLTTVTYPKPQSTDLYAPAITRTTNYDYGTGKPLQVTDLNGLQTALEYSDPLDRLTAGTVGGHRTTFAYTDTANAVKIVTRRDQYNLSG